MKNILAAIAAVLMLAGCPGIGGLNVEPLHAPVVVDNEDAVVKAFRLARNTIDETNGELTALNRLIATNVTGHVWTTDQAQRYLNQSKAFGKDVDKAADALLLGNLNDATVRAAAVRALIMQLQTEVAKAARGD